MIDHWQPPADDLRVGDIIAVSGLVPLSASVPVRHVTIRKAAPAPTFEQIDANAADWLSDDERETWWRTPQNQYNGRTPLQVYQDGEGALLLDNLKAVVVGAY